MGKKYDLKPGKNLPMNALIMEEIGMQISWDLWWVITWEAWKFM